MARKKMDGPRRQLFANIDEELYLKLKSKAATDRLSIREMLELALARYLEPDQGQYRYRLPADLLPQALPLDAAQYRQAVL